MRTGSRDVRLGPEAAVELVSLSRLAKGDQRTRLFTWGSTSLVSASRRTVKRHSRRLNEIVKALGDLRP